MVVFYLFSAVLLCVASSFSGLITARMVVVGDLPADFLRFDDGVGEGTSAPANQIELDEQAARNLHRELNAPAAGTRIPAAEFYASGGGGFVPPNSTGRLSVCLVQARLSKNYGFVKMDPYCRVRVGNAVFETPTDAGGGKNPHWNRTVYCYLPQGIESIYLEIFDERAFTTDERVAWNNIAIPAAVFNGDTIDDWYSLSGQQGDAKEGMINIVFTLYPITAPHVAYVPVAQMPQQNVVVPVPGGPVPAIVPHTATMVNQQAQHGPLYTENDLKELQEMFCNMHIDVITSVMDEKRGNKDAAINALLAIGADLGPPEVPGDHAPVAGPQQNPVNSSSDPKGK